jgi:glycerate kinase
MNSPSIFIAPGPYKECLSSFEVAEAMKAGVEEVITNATVLVRPLSDGGSGIAKVLTEVTRGDFINTKVKDPLGRSINSYFGLLGDKETAIVESALAAGLSLVPKDKRNPLLTSTFGVGELIAEAVKQGAKTIIVGCGDSATNDCGIGCATALGVKFFTDENLKPLDFPTGADLIKIKRIDYEDAAKKLSKINITVACNLTSILCGPEGTSRIYASQKGASPEQVEILDKGVKHFVDLVYNQQGLDLSFIPGAGGAGGLAASLYALFGSRLLYSIDVIDQYVNLDQYLSQASIVLTGEGRIDDRTATGKVACGVALKAKKYGLPVVAIVGSIASDHEDIFYNGIDAVECISEGPISLEESMINARQLIQRATMRVMRFMFKISHKP